MKTYKILLGEDYMYGITLVYNDNSEYILNELKSLYPQFKITGYHELKHKEDKQAVQLKRSYGASQTPFCVITNKENYPIKAFYTEVQECTLDNIKNYLNNNLLNMVVKIKKLNENAKIPKYAKPGDAGLDLVAISCQQSEWGDYFYGTGLAVEIPKGYVGLVFPRSSNRKTDAYLTNHVGVIDSGYRGEIMFSFKNIDIENPNPPYQIGDKLGQLIIIPYPFIEFEEVDELSSTERGVGGFGSTGK